MTPENSNEVTQRLEAVVSEVKRLEARTRRANAAKRQPVEWSAALVLIVFALCVLAGFVSYLYFTAH